MPYVVTFTGYRPSAREDDPWTQVRIEESPAETGPWTTLETPPLDPVDPDPENPIEREFTTELATLASGWYRLTFLDDEGHEEPTEAVARGAADAPTVADVAALLRARTKISGTGGTEAGTFTPQTRPTADQVLSLIGRARQAIDSRIGDVPSEHADARRHLIALRSAMLVELSYFPEQVASDRSPYAQLKALHDEELQTLAEVSTGGGAGSPPSMGSLRIGTLLSDPDDDVELLRPLA